MNDNELMVLKKLAITENVLISAVSALFATHHNPAALREAFAPAAEDAAASELARPWPDEAIERSEQLRQDLLALLQSSRADRV